MYSRIVSTTPDVHRNKVAGEKLRRHMRVREHFIVVEAL